MDSYGTLMSCACWAAAVCWLAGSAATNRDQLELTTAREAYCVVDMGQRLARVEEQVGPYLEVYETVLLRALTDTDE